MRNRLLRTFDVGILGYTALVLGAVVLGLVGAYVFGQLGLSPLGGLVIVSCGTLLAVTVVDRARWGGRRSQHRVAFGDRLATEREVRELCVELSRRGIAAEVERDAEGRPVLGYTNADQRGVVSLLVARGATAPRSGW